MSVARILAAKSGPVVTVPPHTATGTAARRLELEGIGALVVTEGARVTGILSERDIVHGLAEFGPEVADLPVSRIMTPQPFTAKATDSIRDIMRLMTLHRIRHLPVMEGEKLIGMISIGDVVKYRLEEMELEANVLHDYAVAHR